jgi:hypothetical protein
MSKESEVLYVDLQPLQSISMAEERQGEARPDDVVGFSSLTPSLSPALSIPLTPAALAMNLAARGGLGGYNSLGGLQHLGGLQSVNLSALQVL